jgi:hypothetical protein
MHNPGSINMEGGDRSGPVLKLVNLARAAYGAFELETLLSGQPRSASFCPIGRSLRKGVEDWLFTAVGTKYLRIWALGKEPVAIANQIMTAWGIPPRRLKQSGDRSGFVLLPLPSELRDFVDQFDRGLLPNYQGEVDSAEVRQLKELASGMPILGRQRNSWGNIRGGAPSLNPAMNISNETLSFRGPNV